MRSWYRWLVAGVLARLAVTWSPRPRISACACRAWAAKHNSPACERMVFAQ